MVGRSERGTLWWFLWLIFVLPFRLAKEGLKDLWWSIVGYPDKKEI